MLVLQKPMAVTQESFLLPVVEWVDGFFKTLVRENQAAWLQIVQQLVVGAL